jgi:hypothetical protein
VPTATKSVEAKKAEAEKEVQKPIEKKTVAPLELLEKLEKEETASQPKIITKVIRKPKNPPAKPVNVEDDDLMFDFDKEYAYDGAGQEDESDDSDYDKGGATEQPDMFDDDPGGGGSSGVGDYDDDY